MVKYPTLHVCVETHMEMKKLNTALIITVIMLLIVAILVLIKVLFTDMKGFEWGSVSDWFSTAGTLGTLLIAWMAYRKAPEWISQKKHDSAFDIAKKIIIEDLPELQELISTVSSQADNLIWQFEIISHDPKDFVTLEDCTQALALLHLPKVSPRTFKKELKKLRKLGWTMNEDAYQELEKMKQSYIKIHRANAMLWTILKNHVTTEIHSTKPIKGRTLDLINRVAKHEDDFEQAYEAFDRLHSSFDQYFDK